MSVELMYIHVEQVWNKCKEFILNCVINEIEFRIVFCNYIYFYIAQNL